MSLFNVRTRSIDLSIFEQGQQVLKRVHQPTKFGPRTGGFYHIQQVHMHGTLIIWLHFASMSV